MNTGRKDTTSLLDLSIIIVTYNVKNLLSDLINGLNRIIKNSTLKIEVIIIDNGSDDTYKIFQDKSKTSLSKASLVRTSSSKYIKYIKNKDNVGFSKANNQGYKLSTGKYILVLNPDTKLSKDTCDVMYAYMEKHKDIALSTCKVLLPDGTLDKACMRQFPSIKNSLGKLFYLSKISPIFRGYNIDSPIDKETEIDSCTGAFMFIRRTSIEKSLHGSGLFDETFWAMGEDIDLCYRLKKDGGRIMYYPKTSIIHYKGASGGIKESSRKYTKADNKTKKKWIMAGYKSMWIFYKKHYFKNHNFIINYIVFLGIQTLYTQRLLKLLITKK
ncbi:MAG: glycosyltransferase family 2 protein [Patescibacteria group bacterium]